MTITTNAPYTPAATIVSLLNRFRDKGLTFPVTADVLLRAGIPDSLVNRTFQALVLLELVTEDGQPTEMLNKIRQAPQKEYQATLAAWIKQVYAEVFAFADPATSTATEMEDAFRTYQPEGQRSRMVTLFMALCAEAGLASESLKAESKPRVRTASPSNPLPRTIARALKQKDQQPPPPQGIPPELVGVMARLPQNGWTKPQRDQFLAMFASVLDYVIPIVAKAPQSAAGEESP